MSVRVIRKANVPPTRMAINDAYADILRLFHSGFQKVDSLVSSARKLRIVRSPSLSFVCMSVLYRMASILPTVTAERMTE